MISLVAPFQSAEAPTPPSPARSRCEASRVAHSRGVRQQARSHQFDREACEAMVLEHSGRMLSVARRMLRSEEDAADAVQDALTSACAALDRFQANSQIYTWLHRIVVNACLMKLRSQRRRASVSLDAMLPTFDESGHRTQPVSRWPIDAIESIDRKETRERVRACIDQLPDDYRTIVMLRDIEEYDTEQTARLLGLSRAVVKTRLHRARQALRTMLEPILVDVE